MIFGILLFLGSLLVVVGGVWGAVLAFMDHIGWGFAYIFVPFASLVFVIRKWHKKPVRQSFFLIISGFLVTIVSTVIFGFTTVASAIFAAKQQGKFTVKQIPSDTDSSSFTITQSTSESPTVEDTSESPAIVLSPLPNTTPSPDSNSSPVATNTPSPNPNSSPIAANTPSPTTKTSYRQYMLVGYLAFDKGDYQTALINFQRALNESPDNPYALKAIDNTKQRIASSR